MPVPRKDAAYSIEAQARLFGALADPMRLRFVHAVMDAGEASGSEIADELGISLALLCHHSKILVDAGAIRKTKAGQTTYYSANAPEIAAVFGALLGKKPAKKR